MTRRSWHNLSLMLILAGTLTGCGGGGGSAPAGNTAPEVADLTFTVKPLPGVTAGSFSSGVAVNDSGLAVGLVDSGSTLNGALWRIADATPEATVLEPLPGAGSNYSASYDISSDGVSVGESATAGSTVAVFWASGSVTPTALPSSNLLPGAASVAYGINSFGEIAGEAVNDAEGNTHAVYWQTTGSLPILLDNLAATGGAFSTAYAISDAGILVGEALNAAGERVAVAWRPASGGGYEAPIELPLPAGQVAATALTIDASGLIGGESEEANGTIHGVTWQLDAQGVASIQHDFGAGTSVADLCDSRRLIVGTSDTGNGADRVKLWDSGDPNDNQNPLLAFSQAYGVNDAAQIVGFSGGEGFVALPQ